MIPKRGPTRKDPATGLSLNLLGRISEEYLTDKGHFRTDRFPDCNIFSANTFAQLCGFADARYFTEQVLSAENCPIHYYRINLLDDVTGQHLATMYATAANSAQAGGEMWHQAKARERRERARPATFTIVARET